MSSKNIHPAIEIWKFLLISHSHWQQNKRSIQQNQINFDLENVTLAYRLLEMYFLFFGKKLS